MSNTFYSALGTTDHEAAIARYNEEINNNPGNFAAWNNRGLRKVELGKEKQDRTLISNGILDLESAIRLANEFDGKDFEGARKNIEYAKSINV